MPRDHLDPDLVAALNQCTRRTTLNITLGDGTPLRVATGDVEFDDVIYLGKLAPVDELNLELSRTTEAINLKISNLTKVLGQSLINTPNILNDMRATLGCYFKNLQTLEEWHDVKMVGKIETGDIDGDWIPIFFKSLTSASIYNGKTVASVFPESELPAGMVVTPPLPTYDDLSNFPTTDLIDERNYSFQNEELYGRYYLPDMQVY